MKNYIYTTLLSAAVLATTFTACKDKKEQTPTPAPATACNGKTLCFKLNGTEESYDAQWRLIPASGSNAERYRVEYATNTISLEIDMYSPKVGTFQVADKSQYNSGDAAFQHFTNANNVNIEGQSGTVEITNMDNNTLTGKFTVTGKDVKTGVTYEITEGNFVAVPKK